MKRLIKAAFALAVCIGFTAQLRAASTDSLTVTITPNAFYAVDIDTTNVVLDMGAVALSASTQTVNPSTVTVQSTYATTDLKLQGSILAPGGTPWTFDANTASQEADAIASWVTFTSVDRSSAPALGGEYFAGTVPGNAGSDAVDASSRYIGSSAADGTTNLFENASGFDLKDMDSQLPNAQSHLWLNFRLPSATTSNVAQNITITLVAVAPN